MKIKSFLFRLFPSKDQEVLLAKHFGAKRFVYNYFLNQCKVFYLANKEDIEAKRIKWWVNYYDWAKELTIIKKQEEYVWLNEVNSQSSQATLKDLEWAYRSFFRWQTKFPNFKNKHCNKSYSVPQHTKVTDKLYIPKFKEWIELDKHRELEWRILTTTISQDRQWNYFASVTCECELQTLPITDKVIWIDLWIKTFAVCSDGVEIDNPRHLKKSQSKLRYTQKKYSKYKWLKTKSKLTKIHWKVANQRKDFLHKTSTQLIRENQIICIEDLNVKWIMSNHKLAKAVWDCGRWMFVSMLNYKADWYGRTISTISRWFPSSKTCYDCGYINKDLTLKDREWVCNWCKCNVLRDVNASKNILRQWLNLLETVAVRDNGSKPQELPTIVGALIGEAQCCR